jgi:hypothetical protein
MNKRKIKNYLKLGFILFGVAFFLENCEIQEEGLKTEDTIAIERKFKTVSLAQAKMSFLNYKKSKPKYLAKGSNPLVLNPDWNTLSQTDLYKIDEAKLTQADVKVNRSGNFKSSLFFLNINGVNKNVIYTIFKKDTTLNGNIINASVYFNELNGTFIDGYKIEDGKFTKRFIVKKGTNAQQANFLAFLFQVDVDSPCWNTDVLDEFEGDVLAEVTITASGGSTSSNNQGSTNTYTILWGWNNNYGSGNNNNNSSGGGVAGAAASAYANSVETEDEPEEEECNGGKILVNGICECPEGKVVGNDGNCVSTPTPCETALLSRDVYNIVNGQQELGIEPIPMNLSGGWELNTTLDTSKMNLTDTDSGFSSAVYQKLENGVYQYMYVTEGSTFEGVQDWYNNLSQIPGNSKQYEISVQNAIKLNNLVGNKQLYFTGHSLGGGLASVNSLATGRTAFTYNAAGLSYETRLLYNRGHNSEINATVVKGEIVDKIQSQFGIKAEDSDQINYIEEESTFWQDFFNENSPALNTYRSARLHTIGAVIDILDCE